MLADAGVSGGASYDGIVALQARAGGHTLLTLDRRVEDTFRRLGIAIASSPTTHQAGRSRPSHGRARPPAGP
jgi:hypothetical protein